MNDPLFQAYRAVCADYAAAMAGVATMGTILSLTAQRSALATAIADAVTDPENDSIVLLPAGERARSEAAS